MNKYELNRFAVDLFEEAFESKGFKIENAPMPVGEVNFLATSMKGRTIKIKVRAISQMGSYIFVQKRKFDIRDKDLFMAIVYIPKDKSEQILYLVSATEWEKNIYPFKGKDYLKEGQVSLPEWGICYSHKAKDAMESYRFSNVIDKTV